MDQGRKTRLDEIGFELNAKIMTYDHIWDLQCQKLHNYYEKHGHCELVWAAVDRFTFILDTPTNTSAVSLPELQAVCQSGTRKTRNWAVGSARNVFSSKLADWIRNEKGGSTKYLSTSLLVGGRTVFLIAKPHPLERKSAKTTEVDILRQSTVFRFPPTDNAPTLYTMRASPRRDCYCSASLLSTRQMPVRVTGSASRISQQSQRRGRSTNEKDFAKRTQQFEEEDREYFLAQRTRCAPVESV
jgi:hypothetical protein